MTNINELAIRADKKGYHIVRAGYLKGREVYGIVGAGGREIRATNLSQVEKIIARLPIITKTIRGWTRQPSQEDGTVFRWYEKNGITASVVSGYFPNEMNVRITFPYESKRDSIEVRGHRSIMERRTDSEFIDGIEMAIQRAKK